MTDTNRSQELMLLGEIKGIVESLKAGQELQAGRLHEIDGRLRVVEQKAVISGGMAGGAMSLGLALLIEGVKTWVSNKGG